MRGVLLATAMLVASALSAAEHPHDHAATGTVLGSSTYTAADLAFLTHMIVHHRQALELCEGVPARSERGEFLRFARYLHDAQQNEIAMMQALLGQAASRGAIVSPHKFDGDPPMDGMLSRAQMAAIAAARGKEFEALWLEGMIRHHQGGVAMALSQQVAQHANGNQPWGVDVLVDDMLTVQRAEIGKMQEWLSTWTGKDR